MLLSLYGYSVRVHKKHLFFKVSMALGYSFERKYIDNYRERRNERKTYQKQKWKKKKRK